MKTMSSNFLNNNNSTNSNNGSEGNNAAGAQHKGLNNLKRNLTLDLNKKVAVPVLSSPDIKMLNVGTPELEKLILSNAISSNTPTPGTNAILFPRNVTEEQENFYAGFADALQNLHNSNSQASDSSNTVYTDLEQQSLTGLIPMIKEEPQTMSLAGLGVGGGGNSPPVSPVDMEYQERIKLERKRLRNRLAASKCRSRKLERISKLEDRVKQLKGENVDLGTLVNQMREQVNTLKVEIIEHHKCGCQISLQD